MMMVMMMQAIRALPMAAILALPQQHSLTGQFHKGFSKAQAQKKKKKKGMCRNHVSSSLADKFIWYMN